MGGVGINARVWLYLCGRGKLKPNVKGDAKRLVSRLDLIELRLVINSEEAINLLPMPSKTPS